MAKKVKKGRYNFLLDSEVYEDFSLICEELGFVRSKKVEHFMKEFIKEHAKTLRRCKEDE